MSQDLYATRVAISGDRVVIGSIRHDANGTDSGAAYLYQRGTGGWSETAKLLASDGAASESFGWVGLEGSTAVVGARTLISRKR